MSIAEKYGIDLKFGAHVSVDEQSLSKFAKWIATRFDKAIKPEDWRNSELWPEDSQGADIVSQFFALGNSINFRYWDLQDGTFTYCEGPKGGKNYRGAFYMWRSLKINCDKTHNSLLSADFLSRIGLEEVRAMFKDDNGRDVMPALGERHRNWQDFGLKLKNSWDGKFFNLVEKAKGSLFSFMELSKQFRAFDDPLCKLTMVNAIMHHGRGLTSFDERPLPGIDYELLKQLMRNGILRPSPRVAHKLQSKEILTESEALELRMAGLYSFTRLIQETGIPGDVLDNKYWLNRTKCKTEAPVCKISGREDECIFFGVCEEKVELGIPLEFTRYY